MELSAFTKACEFISILKNNIFRESGRALLLSAIKQAEKIDDERLTKEERIAIMNQSLDDDYLSDLYSSFETAYELRELWLKEAFANKIISDAKVFQRYIDACRKYLNELSGYYKPKEGSKRLYHDKDAAYSIINTNRVDGIDGLRRDEVNRLYYWLVENARLGIEEILAPDLVEESDDVIESELFSFKEKLSMLQELGVIDFIKDRYGLHLLHKQLAGLLAGLFGIKIDSNSNEWKTFHADVRTLGSAKGINISPKHKRKIESLLTKLGIPIK